METPLLDQAAGAQQIQSQVAASQAAPASWQSKLAWKLILFSFVLSCIFHKESVNPWSGLWWDICAIVANLVIIGTAVGCVVACVTKDCKKAVGFCVVCVLACMAGRDHAPAFWLSFWPWLTWPIQLVNALHSDNFWNFIKPIWRPVVWGVAQLVKMILPVFFQIGTVKAALRQFWQSQQLPSIDIFMPLCAASVIIFFMLVFPPLWIIPWMYTCPFAQIWLIYLKECFEQFYKWRIADGPLPSVDALIFTFCVVVSHALDLWNMVVTSHATLSSVFGAPLDADAAFQDLIHKGGFKANLEKSSLVRKFTSNIYVDSKADLETKRETLRKDCLQKHGVGPLSCYSLGPIEREDLLNSSFHHLRTASNAQLLATKFSVGFKSEVGIDGGGLTRDWFDSFCQALLVGSDTPQGDLESAQGPEGDSLMVEVTDRTLLPRPSGYTEQKIYVGTDKEVVAEANAAPKDIQKRWENLASIGRVVAVAVLTNHPLPLSFGDVLTRFLCGNEISYNNVRHLDPAFFQYRVKNLLEVGGLQKMNEALGEPLTFVSAATDLVPEPAPLVPGGQNKEVTEENKHEYIQKLSEARLCNGRRRELMFFVESFHSVIPAESIKNAGISPNELSVLISGVQTYDIEDWKANTSAPEGEPVVGWFWQVLQSFGEEMRAKVLHFTTGSSRLPVGGFANLKPQFKITVSGNPEHLPVSHTCACQIDIPEYKCFDDLEAKLLLSLENAAGFGSL